VDTSADPTERLTMGTVPIVVYVAMFGAFIGGQLAGMAIDAAVVGHRVLWVPAACSVVLEAVVGARLAAARLGRPLTTAQCGRLSAYYAIALAAFTLPLWGWTAVSRAPHEGAPAPEAVSGATIGASATAVGLVIASFALAAVVRFALLVALSRDAARRVAP
jgi:hypothetical protein